MENVFWIGIYPGLSAEALGYVADTLHNFVRQGGAVSPA